MYDIQLEKAVALSGVTKQDYIFKRVQDREIVVVGNPRVYKALRNQLASVLEELQRSNLGNRLMVICWKQSTLLLSQ